MKTKTGLMTIAILATLMIGLVLTAVPSSATTANGGSGSFIFKISVNGRWVPAVHYMVKIGYFYMMHWYYQTGYTNSYGRISFHIGWMCGGWYHAYNTHGIKVATGNVRFPCDVMIYIH
jgi:hypothetical protein